VIKTNLFVDVVGLVVTKVDAQGASVEVEIVTEKWRGRSMVRMSGVGKVHLRHGPHWPLRLHVLVEHQLLQIATGCQEFTLKTNN
jgi:hypothetical protein